MKKYVCLISLLTLFNCSKDKKSTPSAPADSARGTAATHPATPRMALPGKSTSAAGRTSIWVYARTVDGAGQPAYKASLTSSDSLRFGFPYEAGSTATLSIRKRSGNSTVYLEVSNGQFNRSFQGGSARIRFDGQPPTAYSFSAAANGRANIIFFDSAQQLINRIKAARRVDIDVAFYAQGNRSIPFRTAGLTWNH